MTVPAEPLHLLRESFVFVFVNPAAGGGRARRYISRIGSLLESFQISAKFMQANSAEELESGARRAASQNQRVLLAMGGDGTFQALANGVAGTGVAVGLLPAGGGNDFATALGIPNNPLKAVEALRHSRPRDVDLVRVCTADGRTRLYVGGGGVGLDAQAALYANGRYRHFPGRFRYIASLLDALREFTAVDVHLEFPGSAERAITMKSLLAGVLKTPTYGAGLRLAPAAAIDDGLLHVVLIEDLGAWEITRLLPRLMSTGELRTSGVRRWQVKCVRLATERPCVFHGDGEILGPTPVEVEVVPKALKMLAPGQL